LRSKDLDHQDRQNLNAVVRIIDGKVLTLLVADAKGTKHYLSATRSIIESLMNKNLTPLKRIEEAWFALLFFATGDSGHCRKKSTTSKEISFATTHICALSLMLML